MTKELDPEAECELLEAAQWYGGQSLFAEERFIAAIAAAIDRVMETPERYQKIGDTVRVYRLDRFPYKLYYEFDEERQHVRFLCVMHNKRRPDYWQSRLSDNAD